MDSQTSINGLFNGRVQFRVPNYQRAYSWCVSDGSHKDCQVNQFFDDIREQDPNKRYYLGHFLFELDDEEKNVYEVIDGQQRLTTIVIFAGSIVAECGRRGIEELNGTPVELIRQTYLDYFGQKFVTVRDDFQYFRERVIDGNADAVQVTRRKSEANIKHAADFFDEKLARADVLEILRWLDVIDSAQITTYCLHGEDARLAATQIFSFQNDRGKDLTTLEKLKAYLMHQIYQWGRSDVELAIDAVDGYFSAIYAKTEELKEHEDTVLRWHCLAFLPSRENALQSVKQAIAACPADKRQAWLIDFAAGLRTTFQHMCEIEKAEYGYSSLIADICYLGKDSVMPLLIKLAHFGKLELAGYSSEVLKYIEQTLFKMTFTIGDYRTNSFVSIAKNYEKNAFEQLLDILKNCAQNGFQNYWDFSGNCRKYFGDFNFHYNSSTRYILYKYENWLRQEQGIPQLLIEECSNIFRPVSVQNTLDHITPQNPNFTTYTEEFTAKFLDNIGNLSLLTWSNNAAKNNNDPALKKEKFNSVYLAQKEIYNTLCRKRHWGAEEIAARRMKILEFVYENWELGDIDSIKDLTV